MQIFKAVFIPAIGAVIIILGVYFWSWKQPESIIPPEIQSGENPGRKIEIALSENRLAIINSDREQSSEVDNAWGRIKPEVVLVEGKLGFFLPGLMNPVEKFGTEGRARELALENNLPLYSHNLPDNRLSEILLKKFSHAQIELTMVLCSYYTGVKEKKNVSPDNLIRECISSSRCAGIDGGFRSAREIDIAWSRDFGNVKNWRIQGELPGYAGEIASEIKMHKRKHFENLILHFLEQGKKVIAVAERGLLE